MSHLLGVNGVQNFPNNFDLNPVTLTYDLWGYNHTSNINVKRNIVF